MSEKTVFISYRRDTSGNLFSRSLKQELTHRGYDVFLDVDGLDSGKWSEQILTQVPKRAHFLLLLTPGALERCNEENDWVRREFAMAMASGRNIVPVREESVDLAVMKKLSPACMKAVFDFQIATICHGTFSQDIATLVERFIPIHKAPTCETYVPIATGDSINPQSHNTSTLNADSSKWQWPSHFPPQLVKEVDGLKIDGKLRLAVIDVITHPEFPSLMSMNGALVENPVWGSVEAEKVRKVYWPNGARIPVVVRADMLLIRRNNKKHEGELLTYPSKWGTHLIHFRPWKAEQSIVDRDTLNRTKFAAKWGVPPETIQVIHTGMYLVSAKINQEYKDLWIYVFEFLSVCCSQWSEELRQIHINGFTIGTSEEDKNRWRHLQEMRNDPVAFRVNGDVLRAIHQYFDVNLTSLPDAFVEQTNL